jgi:predicted phosphate transport protein (TIGR00153 family)
MVQLKARRETFYVMFKDLAQRLIEGAQSLRSTLQHPEATSIPGAVERLKEIEHAGDDLTHSILLKLNTTFITPFDREDIHSLASSLDDVLDFIYAAGERLQMYRIHSPLPAAIELCGLICAQCETISSAVMALGKNDEVLRLCAKVSAAEREADYTARGAIATLFEKERDPIQLIKLKELYEVLETATDKADDVANILESIVLKSA